MTVAAFPEEPPGGLSLGEAWERWRDPALWAKNVEAARDKPRQGHISDSNFWRLRREASLASSAVLGEFKARLREGKLVALGREGSFSAPLKAITNEAWQGAADAPVGGILLRERKKNRPKSARLLGGSDVVPSVSCIDRPLSADGQ